MILLLILLGIYIIISKSRHAQALQISRRYKELEACSFIRCKARGWYRPIKISILIFISGSMECSKLSPLGGSFLLFVIMERRRRSWLKLLYSDIHEIRQHWESCLEDSPSQRWMNINAWEIVYLGTGDRPGLLEGVPITVKNPWKLGR